MGIDCRLYTSLFRLTRRRLVHRSKGTNRVRCCRGIIFSVFRAILCQAGEGKRGISQDVQSLGQDKTVPPFNQSVQLIACGIRVSRRTRRTAQSQHKDVHQPLSEADKQALTLDLKLISDFVQNELLDSSRGKQ